MIEATQYKKPASGPSLLLTFYARPPPLPHLPSLICMYILHLYLLLKQVLGTNSILVYIEAIRNFRHWSNSSMGV